LRFRTCIIKLHLLPTMWPILVEFCSARLEIRGRKKRKETRRRKKEYLVKYKSAAGGLTIVVVAAPLMKPNVTET